MFRARQVKACFGLNMVVIEQRGRSVRGPDRGLQ